MIDGEIAAEGAVGRNEIQGGTYNVGSISKVYCAVAVMQLVEKGVLDLDEPVYKYLPKFTMPDERYKKITLRHCLNHSSGLPGTQWRWLAASKSRQEYYEEVYRFMEHSALHSEPGQFSVYCNDGFTLAEMVIAEVTGMEYGEYCKKYITEKIGAYSSRQSSQRNPEYEHTHIVEMPVENIGPEGAGGIGTTMADLCKFGQLFLEENEIISEASKEEINRPQGATFLEKDESGPYFGLGWDSVDMPHSGYLLGEKVLEKGGGTREFSSRLIIVPKYHAVLSISGTVDCGIDVKEKLLQLFAVVMAERGINILNQAVPIPKELAKRYEGHYLASGKFYRVCANALYLDVYAEDSRGGHTKLYTGLKYNGEEFEWKPNYRFSFTEQDGKRYLAANVHGRHFLCAVKSEDVKCDPLPESWKKRIGKQYVICNLFSEDIIGCSQMSGFQLNELPEVPNGLSASFTLEASAGKAYFEVALTPYVNGEASDHLACGAIHLPYLAGRDLLNLYFEERDGIEYCESSGYLYRDIDSVEAYAGQKFEDGDENQVYAFHEKLEQLPEIPEGRRILVLNDNLSAVYDSFLSETYVPEEKGYLVLI